VYKHICTNNILAKEQYRSKINGCIKEATYNVTNEILQAMNNRFSVGGIFCDLQKAFDCVNHKILTEKLEFYGINGKFLSLIQSYRTGRLQKVLIENPNITGDASSEWKPITNGVPHG
jgi:hypothetical protein